MNFRQRQAVAKKSALKKCIEAEMRRLAEKVASPAADGVEKLDREAARVERGLTENGLMHYDETRGVSARPMRICIARALRRHPDSHTRWLAREQAHDSHSRNGMCHDPGLKGPAVCKNDHTYRIAVGEKRAAAWKAFKSKPVKRK